MSRHLDGEAFEDLLDAGADDPSQHPHLAECEHCREALEDQRAVRAALASAPDPGPPPPEVLRRIEAALAAEAGPAGSAGSVLPLPTGGRAVRRPRVWLAAAAAAVVVVGGGGLAAELAGRGTGDDTVAGSAAERGDAGGAPAQDAARDAPRLASGTSYTRADLRTQVGGLLSRAATAPKAAPDTPGGPGTAALLSVDGLASCLSALGATEPPLAVDLATFDGSPAAVVVIPAGDGTLQVWVVSPSCSVGADGLRYYAQVPDPR